MSKWIVLFLIGTRFVLAQNTPPLPWQQAKTEHLQPGLPYQDYTPIVVPNGTRAEFHIIDGVKVFHLTAEPIIWEVAKGLTVHTWGYNGSVPGPLIEATEGDRVRIYVTNKLPAPTTVHWHGMLIPCGMDGVAGLTQPAVLPGQTYLYEFICPTAGTFMYHPHFDSLTQEGVGLVGMFIVHKREPDSEKRPDRDFAIMLHEWSIDVGTAKPNPMGRGGFNVLTMNGKVMPATEPLVAELGDTVWIRYGNLSAMDHHPIHLHGYAFKIIGTDGGWAEDRNALLPETTVLVPVGATRVTEFLANNPGDWIFHCHMTHHTVNQMGGQFPNMLGMPAEEFDRKMQLLIPGYKTLGTTGLKDMAQSGMLIPTNSIPMLGYDGPYGNTVIGGMANILRVRKHTNNYQDPGPYAFPRGSMAAPATPSEMCRDGIHP